MSARTRMRHKGLRYWKNRAIALALTSIKKLLFGLWPYQRSKLVQFQVTLLFGILTSFIILQFTVFFTTKCTPDLVIRILSFILFFIAFVIKYNSFWINTKAIKCLLDQLQQIYNELKDENEMAIIKKYGYNAKCYTMRIILITVCSVFVISFLSIWPRLLDIIVPMNESRPRYEIEFIAEYFPDQEKYYYVIILHMNAAICIGGIAFIATGTMLIAYLKHACGMFKIARFAEYLISNFEGSFFVLIAVTVCCLSLNLFQIYRAVLLQDNEKEFLLHFLIVFIILLYMFLANYAGQEIIDHNDHIYSTAYNVHWYVMPLHVQKLILFLLQRSSKSFSLNIGGLFAASLQCFASLSSTSISYFTVIYSTQ